MTETKVIYGRGRFPDRDIYRAQFLRMNERDRATVWARLSEAEQRAALADNAERGAAP
jgi:hypothetical protein